MEITWYGHAAFAIKCGGKNILLDPYLDENPQAPVKSEQVKADFILLTHGHGDHLGDTEAIAKRTGALVICVNEIARWLEQRGIKTHGMHLGGSHRFPFGEVKLTYALHGSSLPDGADGGNPCGFILTETDGARAYFAGDTGLFGDMRLIGEEGLDVAALPIGDNYTMGPTDALRAVKMLQPKWVIPIHYNTFPLIKQNAEKWKMWVQADTNVKVALLNPGESLVVA